MGLLLRLHELPHTTDPEKELPGPIATGVRVSDGKNLASVRIVGDGERLIRWVTIRLSTGDRVDGAEIAGISLFPYEENQSDASAHPAYAEPLSLERLGTVILRAQPEEQDRGRRKVDPTTDSTASNEVRTWSTNFMIDRFGRVLIRDRTSQSVQVFDAWGERLFGCRIEPSERIDGWLSKRSLRVTRDKSLWVWVRDGLVRFDSEGQRVSKFPVSERDSMTGRRARWEQLARFDSEERALRSIFRRPDHHWIEQLRDCVTFADGRAVILESFGPPIGGCALGLSVSRREPRAFIPQVRRGMALHFYGADGVASGSVELPTEHDTLSAAGEWVLVSSDFASQCLLVRLEDKQVFRFEFPSDLAVHSVPGLSADGEELLLLRYDPLEVVRFALP